MICQAQRKKRLRLACAGTLRANNAETVTYHPAAQRTVNALNASGRVNAAGWRGERKNN
tara:strand:- start:160 stop:336 length:177 start_codon:yes stop_codon:yes gene_type:complete